MGYYQVELSTIRINYIYIAVYYAMVRRNTVGQDEKIERRLLAAASA